jgi:hypothetical protein
VAKVTELAVPHALNGVTLTLPDIDPTVTVMLFVVPPAV